MLQHFFALQKDILWFLQNEQLKNTQVYQARLKIKTFFAP
jgi:hypothetical protein